jgi:hypothetical protein
MALLPARILKKNGSGVYARLEYVLKHTRSVFISTENCICCNSVDFVSQAHKATFILWPCRRSNAIIFPKPTFGLSDFNSERRGKCFPPARRINLLLSLFNSFYIKKADPRYATFHYVFCGATTTMKPVFFHRPRDQVHCCAAAALTSEAGKKSVGTDRYGI